MSVCMQRNLTSTFVRPSYFRHLLSLMSEIEKRLAHLVKQNSESLRQMCLSVLQTNNMYGFVPTLEVNQTYYAFTSVYLLIVTL